MGMVDRGAEWGVQGAGCRVQGAEYAEQYPARCERHFAHIFVAACAYCICLVADLACILELPEHPNPFAIQTP